MFDKVKKACTCVSLSLLLLFLKISCACVCTHSTKNEQAKGPYKRTQTMSQHCSARQCWELLALVASWHANKRNNCQHCWCKVVSLALITALSVSRFFPLSIYIGPLTIFPQIIVFIWHIPEARVFLEKGQSAVPPRGLTIFWRRRFHEANIVVVSCKQAQHCCATLGGSQNDRNVGTCCAKSLTGFQTVRNKWPTLLWFHANGRNKSQHCWPNNVASVCMGLKGEHQVLSSDKTWQLINTILSYQSWLSNKPPPMKFFQCNHWIFNTPISIISCTYEEPFPRLKKLHQPSVTFATVIINIKGYLTNSTGASLSKEVATVSTNEDISINFCFFLWKWKFTAS